LKRRRIPAFHPAQAPTEDAGHHVSDPDDVAPVRDKALIARRLKFAEIFVQMIAAAGFALQANSAAVSP
jgi:hypothetical protein